MPRRSKSLPRLSRIHLCLFSAAIALLLPVTHFAVFIGAFSGFPMRHVVKIIEIPHKYPSGRGTDSSLRGRGWLCQLFLVPSPSPPPVMCIPQLGLGFWCIIEKVILAFSRAAFPLLEGISPLSHPSAQRSLIAPAVHFDPRLREPPQFCIPAFGQWLGL